MSASAWQAVPRSWPSLAARDFRLYFGAQTISFTGTFMQQVALSWLVYRLTHSAFALGVVAFAADAAGVAVVLFGGWLADRADSYRVLCATQTLAMLQALVLAGLALTGHAGLPLLVALSALLGLVNGVDVPTRQVFVLRLVERPHLGNAIVLTSLALDSARLVGPSLAGIVVARLGEWLCFLLNGLSYGLVLAVLFAMRLARPAGPPAPREAAGIRAGIRYAAGSAPLRSVLLMVALAGFAGGPYAVLMPIMAADVLGGGARTLGLLMASIGCGALLGALFLGRRQTTAGYDRFVGLGAGLFGASLLLFAFSRWLFVSVPLLVVAGFGVMLLMNASHTLLLLLADEDKRGRVMSLFTLSFMATVPCGNLLAGTAATFLGAPRVLAAGGAACALGALWYLVRLPALRREHPTLVEPVVELETRAAAAGARADAAVK